MRSLGQLCHVDAKSRQHRPQIGAEMRRAVDPKIQQPIRPQAARQILQRRRRFRYVGEHTVADDQIEVPAGHAAEIRLSQVGFDKPDPPAGGGLWLGLPGEAEGIGTEIDRHDLGVFQHALEHERFRAGAASGHEHPPRNGISDPINREDPTHRRQPPTHGPGRAWRWIGRLVVKAASQVGTRHEVQSSIDVAPGCGPFGSNLTYAWCHANPK